MITQVLKRQGQRSWACGPYRGEIKRVTPRTWHWRVWHVVGPKRVANGVIGTAGDAEAMVLALLEAADLQIELL